MHVSMHVSGKLARKSMPNIHFTVTVHLTSSYNSIVSHSDIIDEFSPMCHPNLTNLPGSLVNRERTDVVHTIMEMFVYC